MKVTYAAAIGDALKEEMRRDGKVLIYGEDIAQFGNIFGDPETVEESNLLLDGKEAMQYVFTAKLGETEYKFRQVVCTRNGMAYILTYASTAANYDRHADEVQETIAQFKFMV